MRRGSVLGKDWLHVIDVGELHVTGESGPHIDVNRPDILPATTTAFATVRLSYIKSVLIVLVLPVFTHFMFRRLFSFGRNVSRAYSFPPIRPVPILSAAIIPTQAHNIASMSTNAPAHVTKSEDEWRAQLSPEQVSWLIETH